MCDVPFPRRGTMTLTVDELRANVYPAKPAVVLDQCCTVEQKHTVLLGRVDEVRRLPPEHSLIQALMAEDLSPGKPYSKYLHLLDPIPGALPDKPKKLWVINMVERLSIGVKSVDDLAWMQAKRVARMTPLARAKLRRRLMFHFSTVADEDAAALAEAGFDSLGRPKD